MSLVGESERKILKEVVKSAKSSVKARVLPPGTHNKERERAGVSVCHISLNKKTKPKGSSGKELILTACLGPQSLVGLVQVSDLCAHLFTEVILKFRDLISRLEKDVEAVMKLEREERELAASEAKVHLNRTNQITSS